jgi:arylsulfatase
MMWKGVITPGTVNNNLVSGIDLLPTLAEIADAPLPEKKIDGVSILSLINGEELEPPRKSFWYYYRKNSLEAVQDGRWKLVFPHPGRTYVGFGPGVDGLAGPVDENYPHEAGLYDLHRDPGERYNLLEFYPEIVERLEKIAKDARDELGDDLSENQGIGRRNPGMVEQ